jgi:hypothetical protein
LDISGADSISGQSIGIEPDAHRLRSSAFKSERAAPPGGC